MHDQIVLLQAKADPILIIKSFHHPEVISPSCYRGCRATKGLDFNFLLQMSAYRSIFAMGRYKVITLLMELLPISFLLLVKTL